MSNAQEPPSRGSVFREPQYLRFWLARLCSTFSYQMAGVAVGWQIYAITHSTFALGMIGLAQFLPMPLLMLPVGHVADRYDRRLVAAICQFLQALIAVTLTFASFHNWIHPVGIFVAVALFGILRAFEGPATQAMIPTLVEERLAAKAIAYSSVAFQCASIAGPALGGLLYALGAHVPYGICAVLLLAASGFAISVSPRKVAVAKSAAAADSVFSGIHYVFAHRNILGSISLDLFVVLLGGASALLPAFARDILCTGPWGLGLLRLAPAVGSLFASLLLAPYALERKTGPRMFLAVILFGATTVGFALSHSLWLSLLMLALMGAADVVSVVIRASLVQLETPDEMRGRVSAVNSLFVGTSNQLGEFESGVTASWFGLVPATVIGGLGSIVIALLWMRLFPGLRRLERVRGGS